MISTTSTILMSAASSEDVPAERNDPDSCRQQLVQCIWHGCDREWCSWSQLSFCVNENRDHITHLACPLDHNSQVTYILLVTAYS